MFTAKKNSITKLAFAMLSIAVLGLLAVGCSQNSPLAPTTAGFEANAAPNKPGTSTPTANEYATREFYTVVNGSTAVIGPGGGTLNISFDDGAGATFAVPPLSLKRDVLITAQPSVVQAAAGPMYVFDFSPDGLRFLRPAILTLDADFVPGQPVKLYWLNERTGKWQVENIGIPDSDGKVKFQIFHFSKYAIS